MISVAKGFPTLHEDFKFSMNPFEPASKNINRKSDFHFRRNPLATLYMNLPIRIIFSSDILNKYSEPLRIYVMVDKRFPNIQMKLDHDNYYSGAYSYHSDYDDYKVYRVNLNV